MAGEAFGNLLSDIQSQAHSRLGGKCDYTITGIVPLINQAQNSLIQTQIKSLSLAMGVVLAVMGFALRSIRALLAAILPNLLPILTIFAFMVCFGIVLDSATVMIAGIAIGIAVDDTIHFLSQYRLKRPVCSTTQEAVKQTFASIGRAVTLTSITAVFGFLILLLAPFKPIYYFGILGSLTMLTAWIGDVVILPACAAVLKLWEKA
jgi:predicted RND superfamily exporter protein